VFLTEVYDMCRLAHGLLQVPDHEVLALINREEFTHACRKFDIGKLQSFTRGRLAVSLALLVGTGINRRCRLIILEVKVAPLDLDYRVLARMIPNCQRCGETLMIEAKMN